MRDKSAASGTALIILAGIFWGSMGFFVRLLTAYGFSAIQTTSLRMTAAALLFALVLLIKEPSGFRLRARDLPLFLGLGLGSVLFFTVCYFTAIELMPLSSAAILLYTSPIWVMLLSLLFFHERLTVTKLAALALAFGGCVLVSGLSGGVSAKGLLIGLCSGVGYALYSVLGTVALRRYSPLAVSSWTFIIAAAGSWFISKPAAMRHILASAPAPASLALLVLLTALVTAFIPYISYTVGLQRIEASRAAILATVEPMVATIFGVAVFGEPLTPQSALGILLILCAVVVLNLKKRGGVEAQTNAGKAE